MPKIFRWGLRRKPLAGSPERFPACFDMAGAGQVKTTQNSSLFSFL
jgi:hypothetical protein